MSVVGIDIGYQNCYIAVARQGGIEMVANEFSDRLTPACASFGEQQRFIGHSAKNQLITNLKNTVWGWKKLVGRKFNDPVTQAEKAILPYQVCSGSDGNTLIKVQYMGEQQLFAPEQITALMLTKLKQTAEVALQTKVVDCVVNIPCYATDAERRAVLDAAQVAGLNVLRLMSDTTATALAYGIYKTDLPAAEEKPRNIAFVDMGASSLQVVVCAFNKGKLKVISTASDANLGGRDYDNCLSQHFAKEFLETKNLDAFKNARAWWRLASECEKLKKLMSASTNTLPLNIECFMEDRDVHSTMNRETFEGLTKDLTARVSKVLLRALETGKLTAADVDAVEIIGGATRTPVIKQVVTEVFGKEPMTTMNADEVVARGCALQCAILSPTFRVRDFAITDIQPYPITLSWEGGMDDSPNSMEIFDHFHPTPFSKMLTFYKSEPFKIEARYSHPEDIPYPDPVIGQFFVDKVTPQSNGESSKVKVKVRLNIHGVFTVASASLVEKIEKEVEEAPPKDGKEQKQPAKDEKMETENGTGQQAGDSASSESELGSQQEESNNTNDTEMHNDENVPGPQPPTPQPGEKKKKVVTKTTDLPVASYVQQMTKEQINLYMEKEGQMISADKLEKERADAKNAVEEYIYDMREKLFGHLEPFIREQDRENFSGLLSQTEEWLYADGEVEKKQSYLDKLAELKKIGDPVTNRFKEFETRPLAFEQLGHALQQVSKAVEAYQNKDEKYSHLEKADMDKVLQCLKDKREWFEKHFNLAQQTPTHDDPVVTVAQIHSQLTLLNNGCNPTLNKPKPKPKEEKPPKEKTPDKEVPPKENDDTSATGDATTNIKASQDTPMDLD